MRSRYGIEDLGAFVGMLVGRSMAKDLRTYMIYRQRTVCGFPTASQRWGVV